MCGVVQPGELYHASILTPQQIESSLLRWLTANRRYAS